MTQYALIKYPNQSLVECFSNEEQSNQLEKKLIFQPFDIHEKAIELFPSNIHRHQAPHYLKELIIKSTTKSSFIQKVEAAIELIKTNYFQKIVLSKIKVIPLPPHFEVFSFFAKLNSHYHHTCNSLLYHQDCFWVGASPELFLKIQNNNIQMNAIAGTVFNEDLNDFTKKEIVEHNYVTSYIKEELLNFCAPESIQISKSKLLAAGPVNHLIQVIQGKLELPFTSETLIKHLHPTPAVGGTPKQHAVEYILKNEPYREFYSGYLGLVGNNECELYVNLRCAKIVKDHIILYAGCGITEDSDPEKEWIETEKKMDTLLHLL